MALEPQRIRTFEITYIEARNNTKSNVKVTRPVNQKVVKKFHKKPFKKKPYFKKKFIKKSAAI